MHLCDIYKIIIFAGKENITEKTNRYVNYTTMQMWQFIHHKILFLGGQTTLNVIQRKEKSFLWKVCSTKNACTYSNIFSEFDFLENDFIFTGRVYLKFDLAIIFRFLMVLQLFKAVYNVKRHYFFNLF